MCVIDISYATKLPNKRLEDYIDIAAPYLARHHRGSIVLKHESGPREISTRRKEVYGNLKDPITFDIGNGGAGFTGVLKALCEAYIASRGGGFRIGWIPNHSRHTQAALLADIVQVALTYEPVYEDLSVQEGWASKVALAFNDHFILIGPEDATSFIPIGRGIVDTLSTIAALPKTEEDQVFHSRGDGSATFTKENALFKLAGIDIYQAKKWIHTKPGTPFEALEFASERGFFLITDRSTYLTFKQSNSKSTLRCLVEGGPLLLNPCSAMVNRRAPNKEATLFAEWLAGQESQKIVKEYGTVKGGLPLFTPAGQDDLDEEQRLPGRL